MTYKKLLSPNFDARRDGQKPSLIVVHYTGTRTAEEAELIYLTSGKVSPHYMIYGDGSVVQFVEEDKRAWHAGQGSWGRISDVNSASLGIEIWNTGHDRDFEDFAEVQIMGLIDLIRDIRTRHEIANDMILGHSDTAPGRKIDPGEKFPWGALAAAGIGLMPEIEAEDERLGLHLLDRPDLIVSALKEYGYDAALDPGLLLREFHRHFMPDRLEHWGADAGTGAALASLLRQKRKLRFDRLHRTGA